MTATGDVDILEFIKSCIKRRKIHWTYHVNMRLSGRSITREAILDSIDKYEIIEKYPEDKYLPSCLVYTKHAEQVIHFLAATDMEYDNIRIITAYKPTLDKWEEDLKTRRKP